jgi:uncharacterized membrane protein YbhN (UPF0104 family)
MADAPVGVNRHPLRRHAVRIATIAIALALIAAVAITFAKLLDSPALKEREFRARWEYLLPAGVLYLMCHTLWGTFWVQLLRGQGVRISWLAGVRVYFVSQFGKYVPGKAWVILLRVMLVRGRGISPAVIAVTGTYETLTNMAAGAVLGVCFLPWAGLGFTFDSALGFALLGLATVPLVILVLNKLGRRVIRKYRGPDARPLPAPTFGLLARGFAQALVGWVLLALSLWLMICAVETEPSSLGIDLFLQDLSSVSISYVTGFAALILPGGFGAREGVLKTMLASQLTATEGSAAEPVAALVAVMLRIVWTIFEVAFALALWKLVPSRMLRSDDPR